MQRRFFAASAAAILTLLVGVPSAMADGSPVPSPDGTSEAAALPAVPPPTESEEPPLALPPVPDAMLQAAEALLQRLGADNARLASVGISEDRQSIEVYWYGRRTPALYRAVSEAQAAAGTTVHVRSTAHSPAELRETALSLVQGAAGVGVASAGPLADGSGIVVSLSPLVERADVSRSESSSTAREAVVQQFAGVSVTFTADAPVAAADPTPSRQLDLYHLGGARVWNTTPDPVTGGIASCTTGFAVNGPSGQKGVVFAAHCGATGSTWMAWDYELGGQYVHQLGSIVSRSTAYDGAILTTGTSSYPYIWTSGWDSTVYTPINGLVSAITGLELCYSGSYSGLVCGNVVTQPTVYYELGGDLTAVTGFVTSNWADTPAAGNGDSGGPGYALTSTSSGYKRYATGIISAIPQDSPAACMGIPGSTEPGGRRCSPTVIATEVVSILADTGWTLPALS